MIETVNFEEDVFSHRRFIFDDLIKYGFVKEDVYRKKIVFLEGSFYAIVTVTDAGVVSGRVYETDFEEEYLPLRVASNTTALVNEVREEYVKILEDIRDHCTEFQPFQEAQTLCVIRRMQNDYKDIPTEYTYRNTTGSVLRNSVNQNMYAFFATVPEEKIHKKKNAEGTVEAVSILTGSSDISELIKKDGIYQSYLLSKKSWITVILNDTLQDDEILYLLRKGRQLSEEQKAENMSLTDWIVPANPKYFDIVGEFRRNKTVIWKQSTNIHVGDTVYMYVGAPYSCVMYKCRVIETDIPYSYNGNIRISRVMRLEHIYTYEDHLLDQRFLRAYGVYNVQGPRKVPVELKNLLNKLDEI